MKVTSATITAEQIRELQAIGSTPVTGNGVEYACSIALGSNGRQACLDRGYAITPHDREQAHQRCADAWNARHAAEDQLRRISQ